MEKNVRICDTCKNNICSEKCDFCKCDVCESCLNQRNIMLEEGDNPNFRTNDNILMEFQICDKCSDKLNWKRKLFKKNDPLEKALMERILKVCLAENLKKSKSHKEV
jgi:hypothetical protein